MNLTFPEIEQNQAIEPVNDDQQTDQVTAVTGPTQAPLATVDTYAINTILERVERLERSNRSAVLYLCAGFILACFMFLIILLLASLYGGFR